MIRIGVLGTIGSGKSYVAKQFGYPVFNADNEVTKLYKKSKKSYKKLKKILPKYIFSFPIKKTELAKAINADRRNIKKIIKIVHPEIRSAMNSFIKKNKKNKIIILDIPLLLENKLNKKNDVLVFVEARKKQINKRLKKRPHFNNILNKKLNKLQLSIEIKKKRSDFLIKNNFEKQSIKKSVKNIERKILLNA